MNPPLELSDEEINSLTHAILKRHGIDFTCYERKSLRRRITRAISVLGIDSVHQLWIKVLKEPMFIYKFMDEISVGLTSMFRDPVLWSTLNRKLPDMFGGKREINVWHAGCSTGEEVFTMAVLLKEIAMNKMTQALATDISLDSINTARRGEYHKIKVLEFEKNYKEYNAQGQLCDYYERMDNVAVFDNELISNVEFKYHNLITDDFNGEFDIIFCRNVMIYFDDKAKSRIVDRFHRALKPGGLFIIGFYDAMISLIDPDKFEINDLDAKIFRARKRD